MGEVTPWALAVEAMRRAHWLTARTRPEPSVPLADDQYAAMLRAALPHLMAAVGEQVDLRQLRADLDMWMGHETEGRAALLAALTDAAGRLP